METGIVNPKIKEEFIVPDIEPLVDCSSIKEEPVELNGLDKDDNELNSNSCSSGGLEGLGASLAVIKMEMDLPDSSVSQEITETEESEFNENCPACGIPCSSEEDLANHCRIVHSDTFMGVQRECGEKSNETAMLDRTSFASGPSGPVNIQANPGRTMMPPMCLYNCNACRYTSLSKLDVMKHMSSHIEVRILSCEFCLPVFHDAGLKALGVIPYSCGHCLFRTEDLEEMRNHSMVHHKAVTRLSELESEEYVSTSQSLQVIHDSSMGAQKEEIIHIVDDEVRAEEGRKYNLNKENVCSQQVVGDVVNGAKTGRNRISINRALIGEDSQSPSLPVIPRVITQPKPNNTNLKVPPGHSQEIILVDQISNKSDENIAHGQNKIIAGDNLVPPLSNQRVLRPKLTKHLADPNPTYYVPMAEPAPFSITVVHPLKSESAPPVLPIAVPTQRIAVTSTTGGPQNSSPKRYRKHLKKLCPYCGREARDNYCLKVHMLTHSKEKPFACPYEYCSYRATQKAHVMKHLQSERHMSTHRSKNTSDSSCG